MTNLSNNAIVTTTRLKLIPWDLTLIDAMIAGDGASDLAEAVIGLAIPAKLFFQDHDLMMDAGMFPDQNCSRSQPAAPVQVCRQGHWFLVIGSRPAQPIQELQCAGTETIPYVSLHAVRAKPEQ